MWGRLRGQVPSFRPKGEKDVDENDTIVSRALLRYYEPQVPAWLMPPGGLPQMNPTESSPPPPAAQPYARRTSTENKTHMFDRMEPRDSVASVSTQNKPHMFDRVERRDSAASVNASAKPASGLASRLKNSKW